MAFPTNANQVQAFAGALYGQQIGSVTLAQVNNDILSAGGLNKALNAYYAVSFGTQTTTAVGTLVAANLGLTGTAATDAAAYITAVLNGTAASARGEAIQGVLNLFSTLTSNATFGAAATAWNAKIDLAAAYTGATDVASGTVVSTPFNLTTNIETVNGTAADDLFVGVVAGTVTLSAGDVINGAAGTDTLRIVGAGATATTLAGVTVTGVEKLILTNPGDNAQDLTGISGLTEVTMDVTGLTAGRSLTTGATVTKANIATTANAGGGNTLTWAANAAVTAPTLSIQGTGGATGATAAAVTVTGTGATSMTVNSNTAANKITTLTLPATVKSVTINADTALNLSTSLVAAAATTVTIAGAAATTLTATNLSNTTPTIDASKATGAVTYGVEAGATGVVFTGGSANDKVVFAAGDTAVASANLAAMNGGSGTDTIVINDTTPVYAQLNKAVGFEVLSLGTTGATVDVAQATAFAGFGVETGNLTETFNNSKSSTTYTIDNSAGNSGTVTINNAVGEQATSVTINYGAATSAQTLANITVTGAGQVALTSTGTGTGGANTLTTLANIDNSSITLTGAKDLVITNALAATATGSKFDASAFTGKLTLIGSTKADVIVGGSGDDTLRNTASGAATTAADLITTGAGNDTVILSGDVASGTFSTIVATAPRITDFRVGGAGASDILALSATKANYSAGTNLEGGVAAATAGSTALQSVAQNAAAAAYVAGTDLIKLSTGVAVSGTLQAGFNAAIGTATVTGMTSGDEIFFTMYDTATSKMIVGLVDAGGGATATVVETADVVTLIGTVDMSAADYAAFGTNQLTIVAA